MRKLLVANRGEIAVRIMRAAAEIGIQTVAVFSTDDAGSLHTQRANEAHPLSGVGVAAYLDIEALVAIAKERGCDAIHPGYGFLSESAAFARRVAAESITFVGPRCETLEMLGNKTEARVLAERCCVPVLAGSSTAVTLEQATEFLAALGPEGVVMIKAVAGGGGRGIRAVHRIEELAPAWARCQSEALQAFGSGELYVEQRMRRARHIEVQVIGDRTGNVRDLGERECSIQRRHQKLVEIAPCPSLSSSLRARMVADAVRMAEALQYENAGTFEFLVDADAIDNGDEWSPSGTKESRPAYAFIEANPRLQVEHTVTEEVLDIDLVRIQLELASGRSLTELGLAPLRVEGTDAPTPRGFALQLRINAEVMGADGMPRPAAGMLTDFNLPSGPGVRTDTGMSAGVEINANFDSLLAKVIAYSPSSRFADAVARAVRALSELHIGGVRTNISLLQRLLRHPDFVANRIDTDFIDNHIAELVANDSARAHILTHERRKAPAGATVDPTDPLAVLQYGKTEGSKRSAGVTAPPHSSTESVGHTDSHPTVIAAGDWIAPEGSIVLSAPMQGTVVSIDVQEGDVVRQGQPVLVMNAMKMEHVIQAPASGVVGRVAIAVGDTVPEGYPLLAIEPREIADDEAEEFLRLDLDHVRADLAAVRQRHALTGDAERPEAVARRRKTGQRTARENVADLCDPGSFVEYGGLTIAAQRQRRSVQDLIERTPADGLIAGIGQVNGHLFDDARARCVIMSYDYTVLAGTQGFQNHRKKDRMFELAERLRLPVVFFTEGGGGRPGDTDAPGVAGLDCMAFHLFGRLSGLVPLVGINSGRCFAGNAALLGCCDVVIATENSNIGMGGPAMIEGGGLGVFRPEDVGPMRVQVPNGVVDLPVADEAEAVRAAKQYLGYFQGSVSQWECGDQRLLRAIIPENRLRVYQIRAVIETLADTGSVLEVRRRFGLGMVTALVRVEGRPVGIIANDPTHLSGAIDSAGADKAARFMQLCDAFDIPILFLCDTPGIMVGPEVERTALVRHCCRMFVVGASVTVPCFTIVLRKSYGLGAQAMAGGSHKAPLFTVSWPTGEFGGMGLEGAVKLGFRKELAAIDDPVERKKVFDHMVTRAYEHGQALNSASHFEIDDVIDPADSRHWVSSLLRATPPPPPRTHKKRSCVDTW